MSETTNNEQVEQISLSLMEELLATQKEEQKQLTNKIIGLRKGVPKSDKRKKREVTSRIADLEYDLKKKHEEEIRVLKSKEAGLDPFAEPEEVSFLVDVGRSF
jgi:OTU domain-containing protein 6